MNSVEPGKNTSHAEIKNISAHGFWLLLGSDELFVPFSEFPWFRTATVAALSNVEWPSPDHLYWPALDVDLAVDSIRRPQDYPLKAKVHT